MKTSTVASVLDTVAQSHARTPASLRARGQFQFDVRTAAGSLPATFLPINGLKSRRQFYFFQNQAQLMDDSKSTHNNKTEKIASRAGQNWSDLWLE